MLDGPGPTCSGVVVLPDLWARTDEEGDLKVTFIQTCDPVRYPEMLRHTSRTVVAYCKLHGFQYESFVGIKRGFHSWQAAFNKIYLLDEFVGRGDADWLLYMDTDAYIRDLEFDLPAYLETLEGKVAAATSSGATDALWDVNSGVVAVNARHPRAKELVALWKAQYERVPDSTLQAASDWYIGMHGDQALLHEVLRENASILDDFVQLDPAIFNGPASTFIRQYLRVIETDLKTRIANIGQEVDSAMAVAARKGLLEGYKQIDAGTFVRALYDGILRRNIDQEGFATKVERLEDGRATPLTIISEFISSSEFLDRLPGISQAAAIKARADRPAASSDPVAPRSHYGPKRRVRTVNRLPGARDKLYIDVSPLHERDYTGIPQVTAKLCEQLLGDPDVDPGFFYNRHDVPVEYVEDMLRTRNGELFHWAVERYCLKPVVRRTDGGIVAGLHTNMKFARRLFPVEGQIVHDLTTVLTPQFHTAETTAYHTKRFYGDLMSNDVTFCVSRSTALDVATFYKGLPGPILVSHLGVDWNHVDEAIRAIPVSPEPYILVLGTIEPRKNIADVLDLLATDNQIAGRYRFVLGGRVGWGQDFDKEVDERGLRAMVDGARLMRTGFVGEAVKYLLIRNARAVIYPSVYEGFGLPVAEALSLGVPVVTTASSSLPEVGQDLAEYFAPGDIDSLGQALRRALSRDFAAPEDNARLETWRDYFSWDRCYRTIKDGLFAVANGEEVSGDVRR